MRYRFHFAVAGTGEFPKDMLRYDECAACSPEDQAVIDATYAGEDSGLLYLVKPNHTALKINSVRLVHIDSRKRWQPTCGRWESFTWRVVDGPILMGLAEAPQRVRRR
jgi:hypothetical protein